MCIRDSSNALYELGIMYRYGRGTGVDEEKCLRFYEQAAALGHGEALDDLGEAYEYGHLGKEVNIETSIKYYEKSVEADPGPWADIIEKYGNVRTFVLGEERVNRVYQASPARKANPSLLRDRTELH